MPHPRHPPGVRATPCHQRLSPRSHQILLQRYAFNVLLSLSLPLPLPLSAALPAAERAVILTDKSSDVISRRQRISRRLNVSQEGGRSAISLCSTIYIHIYSRARPERPKSSFRSQSRFLIKCTLWIYPSLSREKYASGAYARHTRRRRVCEARRDILIHGNVEWLRNLLSFYRRIDCNFYADKEVLSPYVSRCR